MWLDGYYLFIGNHCLESYSAASIPDPAICAILRTARASLESGLRILATRNETSLDFRLALLGGSLGR